MKRYQNATPEGTKDFLFEECRAKHKIETELSTLFKSRGYNKIITPSIEFLDVFDRDSAGILPEMMYKLIDSQGRLIALRPDSTLPIARVVATRLKDMKSPIRLYYSQNVFRKSANLSGFSDESTQSGIELIGAKGIRADLEIIITAIDTLKKCVKNNFKIEIGHAGFFKALADNLKATDEQKENIREFVEAKDFTALNDILDTLEDSEGKEAIRKLPRLFCSKDILDKALTLSDSQKAKESIQYLKLLFDRFKEMGIENQVNIDLGLVHRNNYYTGVVFRGYIEGSGLNIVSGGRYDKLIDEFGLDLSATGFGIDVDVLSNILLSSGEVSKVKSADVLVFGEDGCEIDALKYMSILDKKGFVCENSVFGSKLESEKYAKEKGIKRFVYITKEETTETLI